MVPVAATSRGIREQSRVGFDDIKPATLIKHIHNVCSNLHEIQQNKGEQRKTMEQS